MMFTLTTSLFNILHVSLVLLRCEQRKQTEVASPTLILFNRPHFGATTVLTTSLCHESR
jgi:hypothetical protein